MAIEVKALMLGMVNTVCYVVGDTDSGHALVIDPADDAGRILETAEAAGWEIKQILATHAHFDHVLAVDELKQATGAPFRLHPDDLPLLEGMAVQGQIFGLQLPPAPQPDGFVAAGETVEVGAIKLEVRHTPGHSPGHVGYVMHEQQIVFCGDCLFAGSIGRTDLPGGDLDILLRSIRKQLLVLDDGFTVAPGHPPMTTIAQERQTNPFLTET
jgi:glyoxylase-like metal-dependent hydrolase (beta-lactamase superfamily II)